MKPHILQSETWKKFQILLGRTIIEGSGQGWLYVGMVEHDRFGTHVYVPYGPYAVDEKSLLSAVKDLKEKASALGAYVVNIELTPPIDTATAGRLFTHKGTHRQAYRTLRIDLSQSEEAIIGNMSASRRKQHRNYDKKGLVMAKSNTRETLDVFYKLLKISSGEKHFYIRDKVFFDKMFESLVQTGNASLFTATRDGNIEVAALVYEDEDTRYYAHVGRDLSDNSLQASAPLISYMIIDAKRAGKKYFDLYGISESDDKVDEKSGFTVFKKTFGGEIVQFAGAWEIPIAKPRYYTKKTLEKVKKTIKKLRK
ncbi:MAG: peptidoglycan bridge formation glycyltransferase FemA/FemB family protein [Candidatus Saccharibacteria bacterium]